MYKHHSEVLLQRLSDRRLQVHHGGGDAQRRVALVVDAVHVLDRVTGESVDKDTGGVGFGHVFHLEGSAEEPMLIKSLKMR